ncbi:hydroxysteroid dehydrogenase-like protein 2 isoform X3 [Dysidea avara]|uniref:hydroxysteroid dehydrogenase-like protein 2 isoform X3 n=1 Tax=Dysidea avara TaxID=196820 RepID=UPI00332AD015
MQLKQELKQWVLAGRTLFITGASRGIGKAIAIKAARDGANIVIAAKTAEPHSKLPGTIYTAAKEVEQAGGQCLPCVMDIRHEDEVSKAVDQAVKRFGGIDIVVNNAGAISLTGTLNTSMKKSKLCLPHLKKAKNPHILNITPPLNMRPLWYAENFAYAISKYGVTLSVVGMSEEFKSDGVAVNALWPRTAIATAAVEALAGEVGMKLSRKPEIVADAAYVIFQHTCDQMTGQFLIDDEVLMKAEVTDLDCYAVTPGTKYETPQGRYFKRADAIQQPLIIGNNTISLKDVFKKLSDVITAELVQQTQCTYLFDIEGTLWLLDLKNGTGSIKQVDSDTDSDVKMIMKEDVLIALFTGKEKAVSAYMTGKLKMKGDIGKAMKLEMLMSTKAKL